MPGKSCRLNHGKRQTEVFGESKISRKTFSALLQFARGVSQSVSWCFEPSQPQRIILGLNTNFTLLPNYSFHKSLYHVMFFCFFVLILAYFYSADTQHGNLHPKRRPFFFFCGTTQELVSHSKHRKKIGRGFGKMQVNGPEG